MTEIDYYEIVRQKLSLGPLSAKKHEKVYEIMKIIWDEEDIKILSLFPPAGKLISLRKLSEKTGISKEELLKKLKKIGRKGTTTKLGKKYGLLPLLPGIFERYFIARRDNMENLEKAAKLFRYILVNFASMEPINKNFELFRPLLPIESSEKLIEINETVNSQSEVLPYELVEQMINRNNFFAVIPCVCRLIAEMSGEDCKKTTSEMGCFLAGPPAQNIVKRGIGKSLTKNEAIEYLKRTEEAGLVHCASNDTSTCHVFICNCCECCCGVLKSTKDSRFRSVRPSNYKPKINEELCILCENCLKKCPMEAISLSESDEKMEIDRSLCIGCGVCASNCTENAITMEKIQNIIPPKENKMGNKTLLELLL